MAQIINEQDVINAICLSQAYHNQTTPEQVLVELTYDDESGREIFGAEVEINGNKIMLDTADIIGALRSWVKEVLKGDPFGSIIELILDDEEGIIAKVS